VASRFQGQQRFSGASSRQPPALHNSTNLGAALALRGDFAAGRHRCSAPRPRPWGRCSASSIPNNAAVLTCVFSVRSRLDRPGKIRRGPRASYKRAIEISPQAGNPAQPVSNASNLRLLASRKAPGRYAHEALGPLLQGAGGSRRSIPVRRKPRG